MDTISKKTFRRFLLGQQALWPGPRFMGVRGTDAALRQMEAVQLDPLTMVARSQDIAMFGRVLDYKPAMLYEMAYEKRKAFDYGGWLCMYPMQEFPHWHLPMKHRREHGMRWEHFKHPPQDLVNHVLGELRARGPLTNRDFEGAKVKAWSYRGRKEASVALFYLWLTGDVMITNRKGFDRIYDLRERVVPQQYDHASSDEEAERHFGLKWIAFSGMAREKTWGTGLGDYIHRKVTQQEAKQRIEELIDQKAVVRVGVEGQKDGFLVLKRDQPHLSVLEAGRFPKAWKLVGPSTEEAVTFLAPLEIVSARSRSKLVFDFDYLWEVYKPVHQRKWGYYTLPILYGDDLVARMDPKLDRTTMTLQILGFWLEDDTRVDDAFVSALANGLVRFAKMMDAVKIDLAGIKQTKLRTSLRAVLNHMFAV
jgi:uncharacterized protein YcaQ